MSILTITHRFFFPACPTPIKLEVQRSMRWALIVQEYNLNLRHIRGKENVVADALSRTADMEI